MTHVLDLPVLRTLNTTRHRVALLLFMVVVAAHWAEHLAQAVQIYVLGMSPAEARGVLGVPFPWLVHSEWMHYGYALVMVVGLLLLRPGFAGRARTWWTAALLIQVWHHFEHLLLLVQATAGANLGGRPVPTSVLQLALPRVELHLFYNAIVFIPMVVAMVKHNDPAAGARCDCGVVRR
ncbi:hypothetical protein [Saccharothrix obliqua]|uniref:hypothetical protein n=1 Tax=Saccharothrix obliqua TaxID=2861747 RepID=UPI001C600D3E|nr:hypothetical protein [Saccharothrix obliqua]MBW4722498.1 hypothetical protein [Saccharothrix obliqua]